MKDFIEKRYGLRMNVDCEIHCKPEHSSELYKAWCSTLSASGISFFTEHEFKIGETVEVNILPEIQSMQTMKFSIRIIHSTLQKDGLFEIGAQIHYPE